MKMWQILTQIFIDILIMIGLMYLMARLIQVWELKIVASGLFGIFIGTVIITLWFIIHVMFHKR